MTVLVSIFGAIIGSFLTVCISRLPRNESLAIPRSHCQACHHTLRWYDLIPILSYFWLKGRCRFCYAPIPVYHLVVEILTPILFVMLSQSHGLSLKFLVTATLSSVLLIIAFIDWHWLIIPNALVLTGLLIAVVEKTFFTADAGFAPFVGLSFGAAMLWLPSRASKAVSGRDGMGAGDIKLAAVLGFYFGWQGVLVVVLLACLAGSIYGLVGMAIGRFDRSHKIPLGFFIGLIAVGYLL